MIMSGSGGVFDRGDRRRPQGGAMPIAAVSSRMLAVTEEMRAVMDFAQRVLEGDGQNLEGSGAPRL